MNKGALFLVVTLSAVPGCNFDPLGSDKDYVPVRESLMVSGVVSDLTGQPVQGVAAFLTFQGGVWPDTAFTDANGTYSITQTAFWEEWCKDLRIEFEASSHVVTRFLGRCGNHTVNITWSPGS